MEAVDRCDRRPLSHRLYQWIRNHHGFKILKEDHGTPLLVPAWSEDVLSEEGDIVQPIKAGVITEDHIHADHYELSRKMQPGRTSDVKITLFKSIGTTLEDPAAAIVVHGALGG